MHWRITVRKMLGRRGIFLLRNIASSMAFSLRLIPPATNVKRQDGISAITCTYNEEDWIEASLMSIKDLVNEILVLDSSTDRTPEIVEDLRENHGLPVKLHRVPLGDMAHTRNLGLSMAKYKWILIWDADFVLKDEAASILKKLLESLDERRYYLIYWPHICLDGDLMHQDPRNALHVEHWLFTWSPKLRYAKVGLSDSLVAPLAYYKVLYVNEPLSFHLRTVRSPIRLLYRHYRWLMRREGLEGKVNPEDYVKTRISQDFQTTDINQAANLYFQKYLLNLVKYRKDVYGDYPRPLKEYAKRRYGIIL
ncbi:glycosyltransferase [Candidatus Bathyarchaeota archaeon]|nr:glycosyltransferase [Candidatus Bathyarchaeota archaeon]